MERLRFVTAASLFDGHDVSINIMRRLLQSQGVEVIHLGHNRSAKEVAITAIQEDAHAVALSSYQGGHNEYFIYVRELLNEAGANNVRIFGGGGGVITPREIEVLHSKGIDKIYSPADGARLGLMGIIEDMVEKANFSTLENIDFLPMGKRALSDLELGKVISFIENRGQIPFEISPNDSVPVLGITGTGGAGKSSLIDEILLRFCRYYPKKKLALLSVDPTKKKTQGALLGDRIRLGSTNADNIFVRSLATRDSGTELSPQIKKAVDFLKSQKFSLVLVETSGIGQASDEITKIADKCIYVMTPDYGAQTQLEKIGMLEVADFIVLNKYEKPRSEDALRDIRKQYRRNHGFFVGHTGSPPDERLPIYGTMASKFNDVGVNALFYDIANIFSFDTHMLEPLKRDKNPSLREHIIPAERSLYLRDIASVCREYNKRVAEEVEKIGAWEALQKASELLPENEELVTQKKAAEKLLSSETLEELDNFRQITDEYRTGQYSYKVREKEIKVATSYESLTGSKISKVAAPQFQSLVEQYKFIKKQNLPGFFPYTAGIFPFKRTDEDPKRMFAGEGGPERTNKRFHYLSKDDPAKRLSTAFDSVTLYGEDPNVRPDIYGKIGESGVSIATLDDMEVLYQGFDLTHPNTSISMTINGPAPIVLAMFMNVAIKQQMKDKNGDLGEGEKIAIMRKVRGTVQADILKEDQAQNTCIFSLEFSLKMMGDMQEYFCKNVIRNYYTVSISGYHIAEAGANPITQLALTLSNGFTYVEYFISRGMKVDDFAANLSYFFSNGLDPEYVVMGSVARKIWAIAMKEKYDANSKSQKFKYHVQTSGRSLHAQEIDFNDIRTTLQALIGLSDNCNSLHTNAYDEAITTPTKESVRRAMAIQMIINREFGMNKTDNPFQGSFLVNELMDLVEEALLQEFERISDKGGVLGAMESMYQRSKIQDESLHYEMKKDSGELPIIGVNTYLSEKNKAEGTEIELSRSSSDEKNDQIKRLQSFQKRNQGKSKEALERLSEVALSGENIFEELLTTVNYCSLGQITNKLYEIGGKYRRNI